MSTTFQISGKNAKALFTLKIHRGDGMALLAMNWKNGRPSNDFVGFAIEYKPPGSDRFFVLQNRLSFPSPGGALNPNRLSTRLSPIQKFRWVHFPFNAELLGKFIYRVTPVFMDKNDLLSYGEFQEVAIELRRETYPGKLNVAFTRGFVSSQAFVDKYQNISGGLSTLIPSNANAGLDFVPTHPKTEEALTWMGFEARSAILEVLNQAIDDAAAEVRVVAYDLNEPEVVSRLQKLGGRLKIIIDNSADHAHENSAESAAEQRLKQTAGAGNVKRQHMGSLQHNKTIIVNGPKVQAVVCGSTNFSWRGFFVQANNAVVLRGKKAVAPFLTAFENYWQSDSAADFGATASAQWSDIGLSGIDAKVAFSPHNKSNALLKSIADDIGNNTKSCLLYSLAFLYQTDGPVTGAIKKITADSKIFVYGISDRKVGGFDFQDPDGNIAPVFPSALSKNLPEPFKSEPVGGSGIRMHHKFVVVDFDKPSARVYLGSYNFSDPADNKNGENLLLIRDRRIAVSYAVEAIRIFDHYHFRVIQQEAGKAKRPLVLQKPPRIEGKKSWWEEDYTVPRKIRDRELFA